MKKYKVVWDITSPDGMFPMSAEYNEIDEAFDCLKAMAINSNNVHFDRQDVMYKLGLMYSGDLAEFCGDGFMVTAVNVK